jgi:hypothetical protein
VARQNILDSDQIPVMFSILALVRTREPFDPVEKLTDWDMFKSLASEPI